MKDWTARIAIIGVTVWIAVIAYQHEKRLDKLARHDNKHGIQVDWESGNRCSFSFCCPEDWMAATNIARKLRSDFWFKGTQEVATATTYQLWIGNKLYETTNNFVTLTNPQGADTITFHFPQSMRQ